MGFFFFLRIKGCLLIVYIEDESIKHQWNAKVVELKHILINLYLHKCLNLEHFLFFMFSVIVGIQEVFQK